MLQNKNNRSYSFYFYYTEVKYLIGFYIEQCVHDYVKWMRKDRSSSKLQINTYIGYNQLHSSPSLTESFMIFIIIVKNRNIKIKCKSLL